MMHNEEKSLSIETDLEITQIIEHRYKKIIVSIFHVFK